jgi:hypothetical protein
MRYDRIRISIGKGRSHFSRLEGPGTWGIAGVPNTFDQVDGRTDTPRVLLEGGPKLPAFGCIEKSQPSHTFDPTRLKMHPCPPKSAGKQRTNSPQEVNILANPGISHIVRQPIDDPGQSIQITPNDLQHSLADGVQWVPVPGAVLQTLFGPIQSESLEIDHRQIELDRPRLVAKSGSFQQAVGPKQTCNLFRLIRCHIGEIDEDPSQSARRADSLNQCLKAGSGLGPLTPRRLNQGPLVDRQSGQMSRTSDHGLNPRRVDQFIRPHNTLAKDGVPPGKVAPQPLDRTIKKSLGVTIKIHFGFSLDPQGMDGQFGRNSGVLVEQDLRINVWRLPIVIMILQINPESPGITVRSVLGHNGPTGPGKIQTCQTGLGPQGVNPCAKCSSLDQAKNFPDPFGPQMIKFRSGPLDQRRHIASSQRGMQQTLGIVFRQLSRNPCVQRIRSQLRYRRQTPPFTIDNNRTIGNPLNQRTIILAGEFHQDRSFQTLHLQRQGSEDRIAGLGRYVYFARLRLFEQAASRLGQGMAVTFVPWIKPSLPFLPDPQRRVQRNSGHRQRRPEDLGTT